MRRILVSLFIIIVVAAVIIALVKFDLGINLWAKVIIGAVFVGLLVTIGRALFQRR